MWLCDVINAHKHTHLFITFEELNTKKTNQSTNIHKLTKILCESSAILLSKPHSVFLLHDSSAITLLAFYQKSPSDCSGPYRPISKFYEILDPDVSGQKQRTRGGVPELSEDQPDISAETAHFDPKSLDPKIHTVLKAFEDGPGVGPIEISAFYLHLVSWLFVPHHSSHSLSLSLHLYPFSRAFVISVTSVAFVLSSLQLKSGWNHYRANIVPNLSIESHLFKFFSFVFYCQVHSIQMITENEL